MNHSASSRSTAIYPITIETPYGPVVLAYRVQHGKVLGLPFVVSAAPLALTSGAAKFWDTLHVCTAIEDLLLLCLPEEEKKVPDNAVLFLRDVN
jgi:hypothetical protein